MNIVAIACIGAMTVAVGGVQAGTNTPIYGAANGYRVAVRNFESTVLRAPSVSLSVERLVDDLEDSTSRLKMAARDPLRFDRLIARFIRADQLHAQVELTFFGNPIFQPDPELVACWSEVQLAYCDLVEEIRFLEQLRRSRGVRSARIVDRLDGPAGYRSGVFRGVPPQVYSSSLLVPRGGSPVTVTGPAERESVSLGSPRGVKLQRDPSDATPSRRRISTREQLRDAVIGAMLPRR
jgi:hypothetical protein